MKIKIYKKKSKHGSTSKAADEKLVDNASLQDKDIMVWGDSSSGSVASSVTAPPSQTASFYKRVLKQDYSFDDSNSRFSDDYDDLDNTTLRSDDDDNLSFAESRSRTSSDGGGDGNSAGAVAKKKKKKSKSGLFRARRQKMFGGSIQEGQDEDELIGANARRPRSTHGSQDGSEDCSLGQEEGAPAIIRTKPRRRSSIGSLFGSKDVVKDVATKASTDDAGDLGYEMAEPSVVAQEKPRRRGSLGGMFIRRGSLSTIKVQEEEKQSTQARRRRTSLVGSSSEHIPSTMTGIKTAAEDLAGLSLHTVSTTAPSTRTKPGKTANPQINTLKDKDMYWLVNQERKARKMAPFDRSLLLETLAKSMVNEIALSRAPTPTQYYGNVGCGKSYEHIHKTIMAEIKGASRKNILSETFTECGVGETMGPDRKLYMVTLFQ